MIIRKTIASILAVLSLTAIGVRVSAQAQTPLPPSGTVNLLDTGNISGTQYSTYAPMTYAITGGLPTGTLYSAVVQGDPYNFSGGLTFIYQVAQTDGPGVDGSGFNQLIVPSFFGYSTNVSYADTTTISGFGVAGTVVPTTAGRSPNGNLISFNFPGTPGPGLANNSATKFLIVRTNATSVVVIGSSDGANVQNGLGHGVKTYGASGPVAPEPASFAVFGFVGLGVLSLMVRARRGKTQLAV